LTQFPTLIDQVAAAVLATEPMKENPHHRAILDTFAEVQDLDRQLDALCGEDMPDRTSALDQLDQLTELLVERMAAGAELNRLLTTTCCCAADAEIDEPTEAEDDVLCCPSRPTTIVHACRDVFAAVGDPDAMASADLVDCLRDLPGIAEGRWAYADLTQLRLARLLAPYGVRPRNARFTDGQRKAYERTALVAALAVCSC
jgi:hypothetical protein